MDLASIRLPALAAAVAAALVAAVSGCGRIASEPPAPRPDILLVVVDTLRADHLPSYGYHRDTAPHLTAWAADATVFHNAHSTSSWTVPSVSSLVTGLYPPSHGAIHGLISDVGVAWQEALPPELPTLAELLSEAGYRTFAITANGHLDEAHGFDRGFDRFACIGWDGAADRLHTLADHWMADIAAVDGPVFVWLHYIDPHFEYHRREPWFSEWQPDATEKELAAIRDVTRTWPALPPVLAADPRRALEVGVSLYDSEIAFWDREFAGLLERWPRLATAATVFASDHGEEFMDHGDLHHGNNLHRATVRIPLMVKGPGYAAGRHDDRLVSLLDVGPTLLRWAGVEVPESWHGRPLPDASSRGTGDDRPVLAFLDRVQARQKLRAILAPEHKLIQELEAGRTHLYDLDADPLEKRDLVRHQADLAAQLGAELDERIATLPAPPSEPPRVPVDPDALEQLRALGYAR